MSLIIVGGEWGLGFFFNVESFVFFFGKRGLDVVIGFFVVFCEKKWKIIFVYGCYWNYFGKMYWYVVLNKCIYIVSLFCEWLMMINIYSLFLINCVLLLFVFIEWVDCVEFLNVVVILLDWLLWMILFSWNIMLVVLLLSGLFLFLLYIFVVFI